MPNDSIPQISSLPMKAFGGMAEIWQQCDAAGANTPGASGSGGGESSMSPNARILAMTQPPADTMDKYFASATG